MKVFVVKKINCIYIGFIVAAFYIAVNFLTATMNSKKTIVDKHLTRTLIKSLKYSRGAELTGGQQRIFFHEVSGNNYLDVRQTCTVESAALHNPDRVVFLYLHTQNALNQCSQWYRVLNKYPNVFVVLVDSPKEFFAGTELENWYCKMSENHQDSFHGSQIHHDAVRFLEFLRNGGVALDLDFIFLKRLPFELKNFVVFHDRNQSRFTQSAVYLEKTHVLSKMLVDYVASHVSESHEETENILTAVMRQVCDFQNGKNQDRSNACSSIEWLRSSDFSPIEQREIGEIYFYNLDLEKILPKVRESFALRTWNKMTRRFPVTFDMNQTVSVLAKQNCPVTVSVASENA